MGKPIRDFRPLLTQRVERGASSETTCHNLNWASEGESHGLPKGCTPVLPNVAIHENEVNDVGIGRERGAELCHELVGFHLGNSRPHAASDQAASAVQACTRV